MVYWASLCIPQVFVGPMMYSTNGFARFIYLTNASEPFLSGIHPYPSAGEHDTDLTAGALLTGPIPML